MERLRTARVDEAAREETPDEPRRVAPADARRTAAADFSSDVQVIYGASVQSLPLVGLRVGDARPVVATILRVDARAPAVVNGNRVQPDYVIRRGDVLEFVHHAGEKGRVAWTSASSSPVRTRFATKAASLRSPRR